MTLRFGVACIEQDDSVDSEDLKAPHGCRDGTGSFPIRGFKGRRIAFDPATVSNTGNRPTLLWDRRSGRTSDNTRDFSFLPLLIATSPANLAVNVRFRILAE